MIYVKQEKRNDLKRKNQVFIHCHQNPYKDKFKFKIENNYLIVKRVDKTTGWDHHHYIDICFPSKSTFMFFKENRGPGSNWVTSSVSYKGKKILDSRDMESTKIKVGRKVEKSISSFSKTSLLMIPVLLFCLVASFLSYFLNRMKFHYIYNIFFTKIVSFQNSNEGSQEYIAFNKK